MTLKEKQTSSRLWILTLSLCLFPASLSLISRQTTGVGWGRQRYLEINTTLTAPIAMEIPLGCGGNEIPDNRRAACRFFYERLMYSRASLRAYDGCSLCPLPQTRLMTRCDEDKVLLMSCSISPSTHRLKSRNLWLSHIFTAGSLRDLTVKRDTPFFPSLHQKPQIIPFRDAINQELVG